MQRLKIVIIIMRDQSPAIRRLLAEHDLQADQIQGSGVVVVYT